MNGQRRFFVPEVVQTSSMDCGPAALQCFLAGFGVSTSYGHLREACQTDVDGTSIDTLEHIARAAGLDAEQALVPADHLLLSPLQLLPAIVVTRQPDGLAHFVVVWRRHGRWLQVMDPSCGRRWVSASAFTRELFIHNQAMPEADWRAWAAGGELHAALQERMRLAGVLASSVEQLLVSANADPSWRGLATLDAAVRMVATAVRAGGVRPGDEVTRVLQALVARAASDPSVLRASDWSAWLRTTDNPEPTLTVRGIVVVHASRFIAPAGAEPARFSQAVGSGAGTPRPGRALWRMMVDVDGAGAIAALALASTLAVSMVVLEALLLRGLFSVTAALAPGAQRVVALAALVAFLSLLALLEAPLASLSLRLGRHLETRLRIAYFAKLAALADDYFHSRLVSDMAERGHMLQTLRRAPELLIRATRAIAGLACTALAIAWLDAASGLLAFGIATVSVMLPLLCQRGLFEHDLRVRTHQGALTRFTLDALHGLTPIRAHGAERSVRREHEGLLVEWSKAGTSLLVTAVRIEGLLALTSLGMVAWLVMRHLSGTVDPAAVLLLVYWAMRLPALGDEIAVTARQMPAIRNVALRVLELLHAGDREQVSAAPIVAEEPVAVAPTPRARAIEMNGVTVRAGGQIILRDIHLHIPAGGHVAIVGASGAGKSSLLGLLLGWHRASLGQVLVDGALLTESRLSELRRDTAWIDPEVQLWNQPLLHNLQYGAEPGASVHAAIEKASLYELIAKLPQGLQTPLGESGALVSGGEGQRVRMARALVRDAGLVILDEPCRGLDLTQRRALLSRMRERWGSSTLLCVTHDIADTVTFPRVVVVDGGSVIEDGAPAELLARPLSRYRAWIEQEERLRDRLWNNPRWRRARVADSRLEEAARTTRASPEATC